MRDWSEEIMDYNTNDIIYSYGFKYSGDKYDITIDSGDAEVNSIFLYMNN